MFCSQMATLQTDLANVRADLTTARSSAVLAPLQLSTPRVYNKRLKSRMDLLTSTVEDLRHQLANTQSFTSLATIASIHNECDQYMGLLRSLDALFDRLDNNFTTLLARARDSSSIHCRGVDSLSEELCTLWATVMFLKMFPFLSRLSSFQRFLIKIIFVSLLQNFVRLWISLQIFIFPSRSIDLCVSSFRFHCAWG